MQQAPLLRALKFIIFNSVLFGTLIAQAQVRDSYNEGDLEMQGYSIDGHESLGLSFDCDNDNFDEMVCNADGSLTVGNVNYTGTDGAANECLRTDGLGGTFFDTCSTGGSTSTVPYHLVTDPATTHGINFAAFGNTWTSSITTSDFFNINAVDASSGTAMTIRVDNSMTTGKALSILGGASATTPVLTVDDTNVGIGTSAPNEQLEITENFRLPASSTTTGIIYSAGNRYIHNAGTDNVSVGVNATQLNTISARTTAVGVQANSTSGSSDDDVTAVGYSACSSMTSGDETTCIGSLAGAGSAGSQNTFVGYNARANNASAAQTIAIGHDAICHGSSICIGKTATSSAANQLILGGTESTGQINDVYFGRGVTTTNPPANVTLQPTGKTASDSAGSTLTIASGKATGNATSGDIIFQTSDATVSGTTLQSLSTKAVVKGSGNVGIGTTAPNVKLDVIGKVEAGGYDGVATDKSGIHFGSFTNVWTSTAGDGDFFSLDGQHVCLENGTNCPASTATTSLRYDQITPPVGSHGIGFGNFTNTWTSTLGNADFFKIDATIDFVVQGDGDTTVADLTVSGGDIVLGTTSIFSGGDTASLNNIDAIDSTTETTLEAAIDIAGDVTGTGLNSVDLDETAVEAELESVLDLPDLQGSIPYHRISSPSTNHGIGFANFTNTWTTAVGDANFFTIEGSTNTVFQGDGDLLTGANLTVGDSSSATNAINFHTAVATGATTDFTIYAGGGSDAGATSEGGTLTFLFDDISGTSTGSQNNLVFDLGQVPLSGTNDVNFTAYGGTAGLGDFMLSFGFPGLLDPLSQTVALNVSNGTGTSDLTFGFSNSSARSNVASFPAFRWDRGTALERWFSMWNAVPNNNAVFQFQLPANNYDTTAGTGTGAIVRNVNTNGIQLDQNKTNISSWEFLEPNIDRNNKTLTNAQTVRIVDAPTEASNNYALNVDSGASKFDGQVEIDVGNDGTQDFSFLTNVWTATKSQGVFNFTNTWTSATTNSWTSTAASTTFFTTTDLQMRGGNVGIGTSATPVADLEVVGEINISGVSNDGTGQVLCVKSDKTIGTCTTVVGVTGACTCQ